MNEVWAQGDEVLRAGSVWSWALAVALALLVSGVLRALLGTAVDRLRRVARLTPGHWDNILINTIGRTKTWVIFVWLLYPLVRVMNGHENVVQALRIAVVVASVVQSALWVLGGVREFREDLIRRKTAQDASSATAIGLLFTSIQIGLLIILALIGLSNLGVDIAALIAGLGVGGIAVALAAQNILGDLLASLSIVLDKPFVVGDFITVGGEMGTVESIGLKTTHLRALSGEELVFSNKDLLESRIRNFKRMWKRRVVQQFGVTYSTPSEVIEKIPGWVKDFITGNPKLEFERCHFYQYGASSLDFEMAFYVADPAYNVFMDEREKLLLQIMRKFRDEKIEFAFPTQSVYVERWPHSAAIDQTARLP